MTKVETQLPRSMAQLSVNSVTTFSLPLRQSLELYARHGFKAVALWRDAIDPVGVDETLRMTRDLGLQVTSVCGWLLRDKASISVDEKKQSVDIAAILGAKSVAALAPPFSAQFSTISDARKAGFAHIAEVLRHGRAQGIQLALEPIHPQLSLVLSALNSLEEAVQWCRELGPGIGLELDTCNVWHEAQLDQKISELMAEGLVCGVQICDAPRAITRERVIMGEGVADVAGFVSALRSNAYDGFYEIELIGQSLWDRNPDDYMRAILASCANLGF